MKIAVVIPSWRRPEGLKASLRALQATASGDHEITYAVSFERDDLQTERAAFSIPEVRAYQRPLHAVPGAAFNNVVRRMPYHDIYTGFGDDVFPLTWKWDNYLANALTHPMISFCWQEMGDPFNASYIASSGRVLKAIDNLCPEYFPFWFVDLWLAEIHHMAFGFRPPLVDGLRLVGKRGTTHGFRDFPFWCQVFTHTRPERMRLAVKLAAEYGSSPKDMSGALEVCRAFDADFLTKAERFTASFADTAEHEYYVLAKRRAQALTGLNQSSSCHFNRVQRA